MKALTLLPKKIKETYTIVKRKECIEVHSPAYINIEFDDEFRISTNGTAYSIQNSKVCVHLWIDIINMHTTVYY